MTFLRTASTRRLLAAVIGVLVAGVLGTTIAIAAIGNGPVAAPASLADAIHGALQGSSPTGVSANITFTDNLFSGSSIESSDPLLTGASGRLWATAGHLRIELQTDNGDGQIVVNGNSFWAYDPATNTAYEGVLPQQSPGSGSTDGSGAADSEAGVLPTVAEIQSRLDRLEQKADVSGATATDVGGQPAYTVSLSPKSNAGLIGSVALSFDANHAVPLGFSVFPRGETTAALGLQATSVTYGTVPLSDFELSPPAGAQVVHISLPQHPAATDSSSRPGHDVQVIGKGAGSVIVVKHAADSSTQTGSGSTGALPLQTVTVAGVKGQQLATSLGSVLEFTRAGTSYLLAGSVTPATLDSVAQGL
jgi:outer membrane lipoprotein-sorting protein